MLQLTLTHGLIYLQLNDFQHTNGAEQLCTKTGYGEGSGFLPGKWDFFVEEGIRDLLRPKTCWVVYTYGCCKEPEQYTLAWVPRKDRE